MSPSSSPLITENGMPSWKRALQGIARTFGLFFVDYVISAFLETLVNVYYRGGADSFGAKEAVFFSRRIDEWLRNALVARTVQREFPDGCRIIDLGGTPWGLGFFLPSSQFSVTVVNTLRLAQFRLRRSISFIKADGRRLPFKDGAFDLAVSIDTLEHIPSRDRSSFLNEIRRVGKRGYLLLPVDDETGSYNASECDREFAQFCKKHLGFLERPLMEHLQLGVPTAEWLDGHGLRILEGNRNTSTWLAYMRLSRLPGIGYLAGPLYLADWAVMENHPPFYSALFALSI